MIAQLQTTRLDITYNPLPHLTRVLVRSRRGYAERQGEVIHQTTPRRSQSLQCNSNAPSRIIHQCHKVDHTTQAMNDTTAGRTRPATTSIFLHKLYESRLIGVKEIMTKLEVYCDDIESGRFKGIICPIMSGIGPQCSGSAWKGIVCIEGLCRAWTVGAQDEPAHCLLMECPK